MSMAIYCFSGCLGMKTSFGGQSNNIVVRELVLYKNKPKKHYKKKKQW